jgi:hypothetical protein
MTRGTNPKTKVYWKRIRKLAWDFVSAARWRHGRDLFEVVDRVDPNIPPDMLLTAIDEAIKDSAQHIEYLEEQIADLHAGISTLQDFRAVIGRAALQVVA